MSITSLFFARSRIRILARLAYGTLSQAGTAAHCQNQQHDAGNVEVIEPICDKANVG
jgi:hypothetical protein